MSALEVRIDGEASAFHPGEEVSGTASWNLEQEPRALELRLFWRTEGRGDSDVGMVDVERVPLGEVSRSGRRPFRFRLPSSPWSFSGRLVRIVWAIELVAEPAGEGGRVDLVVSPTGRPIEPAAPPV